MAALFIVALIAFAMGTFLGAVGEYHSMVKELKNTPKPRMVTPPPRPICLCDHAISFHKDGGRCQETIEWKDTWGRYMTKDKCKCLKYVGPEPLPEYYHPLELT